MWLLTCLLKYPLICEVAPSHPPPHSISLSSLFLIRNLVVWLVEFPIICIFLIAYLWLENVLLCALYFLLNDGKI